MVTLKGEHIFLRALEPEDLDFVYQIENNESIWEISNTNTPYSRFLLKEYLEHAHKDIFEVKQLRLVISEYNNNAIGLIDIFDFDFSNRKAGVGILIQDDKNRAKGYGSEALKLVIDYCFKQLNLHQIYCNISEENVASLRLFKKFHFKNIGLKKDWNLINGNYQSEFLLQLINSN